jgi:uncharacterized delta-60 repeat protein
MARSAKSLLLTVLLGLLAIALVPASAPGNLDSTFSGDGRVRLVLDPSSFASPSSMAIDHQGRIVVAGFFAQPSATRPLVARFNPDGSLDPSFGSGGVLELPWGGGGMANAVAVDEAGRIVLGGILFSSPDNDAFVARLLDNGQPDLGFAGDGLLAFDVERAPYSTAFDLKLDARGRILLAVSALFGLPESQFAVARVTTAGALDPSFGEDGIAGVGFGSPSFPAAVEVDARGRVLLAGSAGPLKGMQFAIVRFDDAGRLDPSFDGDGRATLEAGPYSLGESVTDMALDARGRPVLLGGSGGIRRLLPDGSPDPGFGSNGGSRVSLPNSGAAGIAIAASGRILVVGRVLADQGEEAFLARFRPDGARDPWFGARGIVRESYLTTSASGDAVAIDSAGRYLIAGAFTGSTRGIGLARYLGDRGRCRGRPATLVGTARRDTLRGTRRRDVIVGRGGNDRIRAFGGRDLVCAGAGNDRVFGGRGNDRLFGQAGRDLLVGGPGRDRRR